MIFETTTSQLNDALKKYPKTMAFCTAPWCHSCKSMEAPFKKLSDKYRDTFFCKIDVGNETEIVNRYGIKGLPTFIFFEDGDPKQVFIGGSSTVMQQIEKLL